MTAMISEVYQAFKEASVSDETARKAAEAIAAYDSRFASLELKIERLDGRVSLVQWMIGGVYVLVTLAGVPSVWLLLRVAAKIGALP